MKKNKTQNVDLTWKINPKGNWNRKFPGKNAVYTKPITQIFIDGDELIWKHDEILELIKAYHQADVDSIEMIKKGEAGEVKNYEKPLLEKIQDLIKNLKKEEVIRNSD